MDGSSFGLGLAVMSEVKPYRGHDNKTELLPFIQYENRWLRVLGPGVEFKLGRAGPVAFGVTASFGMDGYEAGDSPFLEGMARRRSSVWLGARAGLRTELASLSAEWSADASGHSQGQRFKLGIERRIGFGPTGLTLRASATWLDRSYVQYHYGVEAAEARVGRDAHAAGSAVNTSIGLRVDHRLAPQHLVMLDVVTVSLGSAIRQSPLVDRRSVPEVRLGYLYRF